MSVSAHACPWTPIERSHCLLRAPRDLPAGPGTDGGQPPGAALSALGPSSTITSTFDRADLLKLERHLKVVVGIERLLAR